MSLFQFLVRITISGYLNFIIEAKEN